MHKSIWQLQDMPTFKSFAGNIKTDVLIIGGGLCGLLCAHFLKDSGIDCIVVEARNIFSGTSSKSTGKITSQHGLIYSKIKKIYGMETASAYLAANNNAVKKYSDLCADISCDFEYKNAYTYTIAEPQKIEDEVSLVNNMGFDAKFVIPDELPFETKGAICFENQAQFNPVKFAAHICKDINIYENTFIYELTPTAAYTAKGIIKADKFIVASHFPFINMHGSYFAKLYQHRSYMCSYVNAPLLNGMYIDHNPTGLSLSSYNNCLILGGSGHRTGKKTKAWDTLHKFASEHYPNALQTAMWSAQDCMSLDGMPYIGKYSKNMANTYVATGFNKWGITSSMVAAQVLTDAIYDKRNDYADIFSPQRKMYLPQLGANALESAKNILTPSAKRCPHMGCALKWNKYEHSWDCPCHGSRFDQNGKLIDNPAMRDADVK